MYNLRYICIYIYIHIYVEYTSASTFYLHCSKPLLSLPELQHLSWSLPCFHFSPLQSILHQAAR